MSSVWLAFQPQDAYGLEKLATEELCKHYTKDFGIECRIGRFHNIYGPFGTWKGRIPVINRFIWVVYIFAFQDLYVAFSTLIGGREKAPAAFCRKAITSTDKFEMWGDGKQTRSFTFIDECVEGVLRYNVLDWTFTLLNLCLYENCGIISASRFKMRWYPLMYNCILRAT